MDEEWAEKATFYTSPAVMSEHSQDVEKVCLMAPMPLSPPLPPRQRTQGQTADLPNPRSTWLPQRPPSWCVSRSCAQS